MPNVRNSTRPKPLRHRADLRVTSGSCLHEARPQYKPGEHRERGQTFSQSYNVL